MNFYRIEVQSQSSSEDSHLKEKIRHYLNIDLAHLKKIKLFLLEVDYELSPRDLLMLGQNCFSDPIHETFQYEHKNEIDNKTDHSLMFAVEVTYRPGVTDNTGLVASEALTLLGYPHIKVHSGFIYLLQGFLNYIEIEKITKEFFANDLIQKIRIFPNQEFVIQNRFQRNRAEKMDNGDNNGSCKQVETISFNQSMNVLHSLNQKKGWAFNQDELLFIRNYFLQDKIQKERAKLGLPLDPTDVEIELMAQTWSEHCKHKIFNSEIDYEEAPEVAASYHLLGRKKIHSLFKSYIRKSTMDIIAKHQLDWTVSLFVDNAGVVRFDPRIDYCIKVETHNSPSALDPYGGALTGILGVNRDVLGCGMGARPIANTNVFCVAPPSFENELPLGLKHPRQILRGIHQGVADGGNKSGIPTVNGSFLFDDNFAGKPLVFCGTIGILPYNTSEKKMKVGDLVVMVGGAIGKDGIHGATLSSMEMNENTSATMVQIGDPFIQKRMADFILEARDRHLFTSITDNGAGGLSSSVGEMSLMTGGASIDLSLCPLKYQGLLPYEILISESQERMTLAVDPLYWKEFSILANKHGVRATALGEFNQTGFLSVKYRGEMVAHLSLSFLHDQLPAMVLKAKWYGPEKFHQDQGRFSRKQGAFATFIHDDEFDNGQGYEVFKKVMLGLLKSPNIRSKESWVRQYDHEVQGATHIKPFVGKQHQGPSDAAVLWMSPHGGDDNRGLAIGHGLNPKLSSFDPYFMAQFAVDEAVRNIVAVGGNPQKMCLVDNFCWPDPLYHPVTNPDGDHKLAQLVRACEGLYDATLVYGTPCVSGKDSMKNDFHGKIHHGRGERIKISALPTLLMTGMADIEDIRGTVTSDFKGAGDLIYLLGESLKVRIFQRLDGLEINLAGSEMAEYFSWNGQINDVIPSIDLQKNIDRYKQMYACSQRQIFASIHDISDGGWMVSLIESTIGGELGSELQLNFLEEGFPKKNLSWFFHEAPGRFIVSISPPYQKLFEEHFADESIFLGKVSEQPNLKMHLLDNKLQWNFPLEELKSAWRQPWV